MSSTPSRRRTTIPFAPTLVAMPHPWYVTYAHDGRYFGEAAEEISAVLAGSPIRMPSGARHPAWDRALT